MSRFKKDNEGFMLELMRFSRYGALAQGFIFQAIREYAKQVAEADPKLFEPEKSEAVVLCIHGPAWQGVAKEIFEKMEKRFEDDRPIEPQKGEDYED